MSWNILIKTSNLMVTSIAGAYFVPRAPCEWGFNSYLGPSGAIWGQMASAIVFSPIGAR